MDIITYSLLLHILSSVISHVLCIYLSFAKKWRSITTSTFISPSSERFSSLQQNVGDTISNDYKKKETWDLQHELHQSKDVPI